MGLGEAEGGDEESEAEGAEEEEEADEGEGEWLVNGDEEM